MQTTNANQDFSPDHPIWCLLAEFSLSEFLSNYDRRGGLTAGLLFQAVRDLDMSPEWVVKIERTLVEFANEEMVHFEQGALEIIGRIRLFCQKKSIDDANSAGSTPRPHQKDPAIEHKQMKLDPGKNMKGGWGYFMVERRGNSSLNFSADRRNFIDLYLYKEGELYRK